MKVSPQDIESIVLQIFSSLRICAGGKLHHSTLYKYWQRYRFRDRDFNRALGNLIGCGAITTENGAEELVLVLTPAGAAMADASSHRGIERLAHTLRMSWLSLLRCREDTGSKVRRPNRRLGRATDRGSDQLRARAGETW